MDVFLFILTNNIIPIFALILFGYILDKQFKLNIYTLSKLNFYVFIPAFMFVNLYTTEIPFEMIKISLFAVCLLILNMLIAKVVSIGRKFDSGLKYAFSNSIMFYNTGNIGIPLITLVYSSAPYMNSGETPYLNIALTAHIMVLLVQTISLTTLGFFNAGRASSHWKDSMIKIFKMPTIYVILITFVLKSINYDFTRLPVWQSIVYASRALVPIALLSLGIQLSRTKFGLSDKDMYLSVFIRLLIGPVIALAMIELFNMEGILAQVALITSALPTAVNTALIAVEYDNHPDFASQVVLLSTLLCMVTLVSIIYFAQIIYPLAI